MDQNQSVEFAKDYLSNIIAFFGENLTVNASIGDDIINLEVEDSELNSILIGRGAETLRSLQLLVSMALRNQGAELSRVSLDIGGYKKQREEKIAEQTRVWIEEVRSTGNSHVAYLNAADRRIVHRVASEFSDIRTHSEGEGRERRIIIAQTSS